MRMLISLNRCSALFVIMLTATGILEAGCTMEASPVEAEGTSIGSAQEASTITVGAPGDPRLKRSCTSGGLQVVRSAGLEVGSCPASDEFTFNDAISSCGGNVKQFVFACIDLLARHGWTAAYACCQAQCVPPPPALTNWWPGDGNASSQVGGPAGTLVGGVTFGPAKVGQGYHFDGTGYVDFGTGPSITGTGPFTVDAWVQTATGGVIIQQRDANGFDGEYRLLVGSDEFDLPLGKVCWADFGDGQSGFSFCSNASVNDGRFHLIAATREADGSGRIYIDGILDSSQSAPPVTLVPLTVYIGEDVRDGVVPLTGTIDEVEIFNRALTPAEILGIFGASSAGKCK